MSASRHTEAQMVEALKQMEAGRPDCFSIRRIGAMSSACARRMLVISLFEQTCCNDSTSRAAAGPQLAAACQYPLWYPRRYHSPNLDVI